MSYDKNEIKIKRLLDYNRNIMSDLPQSLGKSFQKRVPVYGKTFEIQNEIVFNSQRES